MIYLDSSVVLAHLYGEDKQPPDSLWKLPMVSSRLLEYEVWTRIHAHGLTASHDDATRTVLGRVAFIEMIGEVLGRVRQPFPANPRTLDALHLASFDFIASQGQHVALASYDERMLTVARELGFAIHPLG